MWPRHHPRSPPTSDNCSPHVSAFPSPAASPVAADVVPHHPGFHPGLHRPSSSRVLVPAPLPAYNPDTIIASLPAPSGELVCPPETASMGPISAPVTLPERLKPGRKPATDTPNTKRKAQNRESQRNFRQRKADRYEEMKAQLESERQEHKAKMNGIIAENSLLRMETERLREEIRHVYQGDESKKNEVAYWQTRCAGYEKTYNADWKRKESGHSVSQPMLQDLNRRYSDQSEYAHHRSRQVSQAMAVGYENGTPDGEYAYDSLAAEVDYTAQFSADRSSDSCGFCKGYKKGVCPCSDAATGPGSCEACQADPQQKAWCLKVAESNTPSNHSRNSSIGSGVDPRDATRPNNASGMTSINCRDTYKLLEGRVHTDEDWVTSNLRPVTPDPRRDTHMVDRQYSALELETASVITTLQNSMTRLEPRPSDGQYQEVVATAAEYQTMSMERDYLNAMAGGWSRAP
ncbi:hypothetical protein BDV95DRAFT_668563 [Massariosphaeria phaeospora]|uniref:BZIP domain-containing protein n=1 Tax=Massariosphaeria phaeospora TaxID=100035 RepID=A0A7C8M7Y6_9PLEO|nr:hypothetical protein BDV95DRAFT_668563 [Massariosphaeria phaeospora]